MSEQAQPAMRAKMVVCTVQPSFSGADLAGELLTFSPVAKNDYRSDPLDENNTFAKYTPSANLSLFIANPALFGKFRPGEAYYLDFTKAEA